jgi:hypothetical protein
LCRKKFIIDYIDIGYGQIIMIKFKIKLIILFDGLLDRKKSVLYIISIVMKYSEALEITMEKKTST